MTIDKVREILEAQVHTCPELLDTAVESAFGADLMSDVLAFSAGHTLLLTGLINLQAIRTAEMMDMRAVVFVRGKMPTPEIIQLAQAREMVLMTTALNMYNSCGRLYESGLR